MDAKVPGRPLSRTESKERTFKRVLEGARKLTLERGFTNAHIRDIAAEIGRSTGAVFAHFQSKEELFPEIVRAELAAWTTDAFARNHPGLSPVARTIAVFYPHDEREAFRMTRVFAPALMPEEIFLRDARRLRELVLDHAAGEAQTVFPEDDARARFNNSRVLAGFLLPLAIECSYYVLGGMEHDDPREWFRARVEFLLNANF